jgi:hypothetical protein
MRRCMVSPSQGTMWIERRSPIDGNADCMDSILAMGATSSVPSSPVGPPSGVATHVTCRRNIAARMGSSCKLHSQVAEAAEAAEVQARDLRRLRFPRQLLRPYLPARRARLLCPQSWEPPVHHAHPVHQPSARLSQVRPTPITSSAPVTWRAQLL